MTLQPLTDDELPALPKPSWPFGCEYNGKDMQKAQRQAAEAQRLKSGQEVARLVSENEAQAAEIARLRQELLKAAYEIEQQSARLQSVKFDKEQIGDQLTLLCLEIRAALNTKEQP